MGTVRIHACLLRVPRIGNRMKELEKSSKALGEALACLTFLEIVVLETSDGVNHGDGEATMRVNVHWITSNVGNCDREEYGRGLHLVFDQFPSSQRAICTR